MRDWRDCTNCAYRTEENVCVVKGVKVLEDYCDPFDGCGFHEFQLESESGCCYTEQMLDNLEECRKRSNLICNENWDDEEFPF